MFRCAVLLSMGVCVSVCDYNIFFHTSRIYSALLTLFVMYQEGSWVLALCDVIGYRWPIDGQFRISASGVHKWLLNRGATGGAGGDGGGSTSAINNITTRIGFHNAIFERVEISLIIVRYVLTSINRKLIPVFV